jgi:hypothetical protein
MIHCIIKLYEIHIYVLINTEFGTARGQGRFPWEEAVKACIHIQQVRIELVISVNQERGTGMDHVASANHTPCDSSRPHCFVLL